jgi:hypothetical protein
MAIDIPRHRSGLLSVIGKCLAYMISFTTVAGINSEWRLVFLSEGSSSILGTLAALSAFFEPSGSVPRMAS